MVKVLEIGSMCTVQLIAKYPLFTEQRFHETLLELGYENGIDTTNNDQPFYKKDDIIIFTDYKQLRLVLKLRNVVTIQQKYNEFITLLAKLGFQKDALTGMSVDLNTNITDINDPLIFATKLLKETKSVKIGEYLNIAPSILSIVLANTDATNTDIQIRLEPLTSSPKDTLYCNIKFGTKNYDVFDKFMSNLNTKFISDLIIIVDE